MQSLQIYLLGDFRLDRGGRPLPPIASRAGRSLVAYLIMFRRRHHSRDELAATFWPDLAQPRGRLSHALWQCQDVLGELEAGDRYLDTTPETLAFNTAASCWLDVEEFERRLRHVSQSPRRPRGTADLDEAGTSCTSTTPRSRVTSPSCLPAARERPSASSKGCRRGDRLCDGVRTTVDRFRGTATLRQRSGLSN